MNRNVIVDVNPEFSFELVLVVPFAYWAHTQGKLTGVYSSVDMRPFYYFSDKFVAKYKNRTIDNDLAGMNKLHKLYGANNWLHGINPIEEPGVLNYKKWIIPPYKEYYKNDEIKFNKPFVVISNQYNIERGLLPQRYFNISFLYEMFNYFTESGYKVIYKRPKNTEFVIDQNEMHTRQNKLNLVENVEGIGIIDDHQLTEYYEDVILFDDLHKQNLHYDYNTLQLKTFANAEGFISVAGGSAMLCAFFQKPTIIYSTVGRENLSDYWNKNAYYQMISNNNAHPVIDDQEDIKKRGHHNYDGIRKYIKEHFKNNKRR